MRINKSRAREHIVRCHRVRKNCKFLRSKIWTIIQSNRFDKGAFVEEGKTLYIAIDGSSKFLEWISNLNVRHSDGAHRGFEKHGKRLFTDLQQKLKHSIEYYDTVIMDGHSRGGALVQIIAREIKRKNPECDIEVVTSGSPVVWDLDTLNQIINTGTYTHHAMRTAKDFVDDINAPKSFKKLRLHHYVTEVYNLPTVKGKIDHLGYEIAIERYGQWER